MGMYSVVLSFQEWEWVYGKTPKFSVTTSMEFPTGKIVSVQQLSCSDFSTRFNFVNKPQLFIGSCLKGFHW